MNVSTFFICFFFLISTILACESDEDGRNAGTHRGRLLTRFPWPPHAKELGQDNVGNAIAGSRKLSTRANMWRPTAILLGAKRNMFCFKACHGRMLLRRLQFRAWTPLKQFAGLKFNFLLWFCHQKESDIPLPIFSSYKHYFLKPK